MKKAWLFSVYRGWNPTQVYRDYNKPLFIGSRNLNQPGWLMESRGKTPFFFWTVAQLIANHLYMDRNQVSGCRMEWLEWLPSCRCQLLVKPKVYLDRHPPKQTWFTWKWTLGKGDSYWKPSFPGSMLIFWGCILGGGFIFYFYFLSLFGEVIQFD